MRESKSSLMPKIVAFFVGLIILIIAASYVKSHSNTMPQTPMTVPQTQTQTQNQKQIISTASAQNQTNKNSALANPASVNCTKMGGTLSIEKDGAGNEYGLCNLGSGYACEEWALIRGQCPKNGVKTTGLDTKPEMYCAWLGGQTLAVKNATCTLPSGKVCPDETLYAGKCNTTSK